MIAQLDLEFMLSALDIFTIIVDIDVSLPFSSTAGCVRTRRSHDTDITIVEISVILSSSSAADWVRTRRSHDCPWSKNARSLCVRRWAMGRVRARGMGRGRGKV